MLERIQSQAIRFIQNAKGRDFSVTVTRERLNLDLLQDRKLVPVKILNNDKFSSLNDSYDQIVETVTNIQTRPGTKAFLLRVTLIIKG